MTESCICVQRSYRHRCAVICLLHAVVCSSRTLANTHINYCCSSFLILKFSFSFSFCCSTFASLLSDTIALAADLICRPVQMSYHGIVSTSDGTASKRGDGVCENFGLTHLPLALVSSMLCQIAARLAKFSVWRAWPASAWRWASGSARAATATSSRTPTRRS